MAILGTQTLLSFPEKSLMELPDLRLFYGLYSFFLWACYFIALTGHQQEWLAPFSRWLPMSYQMPFSSIAFICALLITLVWFLRTKLFQTLYHLLFI